MIEPVIRIFSTMRPAMLAAVPSITITKAISACWPGSTSQPNTLATKPAEKIDTAAMATTSVHM